jgi:hypothetical protein
MDEENKSNNGNVAKQSHVDHIPTPGGSCYKFIEEDSPRNLLMEPTGRVSAATIHKLIERLTYSEYVGKREKRKEKREKRKERRRRRKEREVIFSPSFKQIRTLFLIFS